MCVVIERLTLVGYVMDFSDRFHKYKVWKYSIGDMYLTSLSTIVAPACCYTPTWWPNLPESWQEIEIFSWSEAWNPPTWGCKSMVEGLTIMLGVFITLLCIYTMPNIYYSATYMLLYPHLMAKLAWSWQEIEIFSWSEAWNPPTWGCKSMVEGLTIMLGVFTDLVIHLYNAKHLLFSNLHAAIPPLDGQTCLKLAENRDFFLIWGMKPANMGL